MTRRLRGWKLLVVPAAIGVLFAVQPGTGAQAVPPPIATVGGSGNEPLLAVAPDGTMYISALQYLYVSTNGGASWSSVTTPVYASTANLNSDSSIAVDASNRLYFSFDWPYAGGTATCYSDNRGVTWACDPETLPGGTDRMWTTAPSTSRSYLVTNEGLYKTIFFTSTDRGATYVPTGTNVAALDPQTGQLLPDPSGLNILQPINSTTAGVVVWTPGTANTTVAPVRTSGLPLTVGLPSGGFTPDGTFYLGSESANAAGGRGVALARTTNLGTTWTSLPLVTGTTTGTATFSAVATGANGDVGVLFYSTTDNGDPSTLGSTWSVKWARSSNANTATPTWTVTTLENSVHSGPICAAAGCMGNARFAGDFIGAVIDRNGAAHVTWMVDGGAIHFANV